MFVDDKTKKLNWPLRLPPAGTPSRKKVDAHNDSFAWYWHFLPLTLQLFLVDNAFLSHHHFFQLWEFSLNKAKTLLVLLVVWIVKSKDVSIITVRSSKSAFKPHGQECPTDFLIIYLFVSHFCQKKSRLLKNALLLGREKVALSAYVEPGMLLLIVEWDICICSDFLTKCIVRHAMPTFVSSSH